MQFEKSNISWKIFWSNVWNPWNSVGFEHFQLFARIKGKVSEHHAWIPGNFLKNLEISWKNHGILLARWAGNAACAMCIASPPVFSGVRLKCFYSVGYDWILWSSQWCVSVFCTLPVHASSPLNFWHHFQIIFFSDCKGVFGEFVDFVKPRINQGWLFLRLCNALLQNFRSRCFHGKFCAKCNEVGLTSVCNNSKACSEFCFLHRVFTNKKRECLPALSCAILLCEAEPMMCVFSPWLLRI